ncbi:MAG: cyclic nucleotide-binding domain-containing protein [Oligoflexales bacterium]
MDLNNEFQEDLSELKKKFSDPKWGAEQLRKISLFSYVSNDELLRLYSLGEVLNLKPKAYAIIEGEPTRGVFLLLHGKVSIYKNDPTTNAMHRLAMLEDGAIFGEFSLFDSAPRSATVGCEANCFLFSLDAEVFENFLEKEGDNLKTRFYKKCVEELVERFRTTNSDYLTSQQLLWKYALRRDGLDEKESSPEDEDSENTVHKAS